MSDTGDGDFNGDGGFAEEAEFGGDDVYEEVTTKSWCERLTDSCAGICIGLILFIGAFPLLYWNEGRAVDRYDALRESESLTTSVSALSVDSRNEGKIVHLAADLANGGPSELVDPIFNVSSPGILKLQREAEMYQWNEVVTTSKKTKTGGSKETTKSYEYEKDWSENLVNSVNFKRQSGHENPSTKKFESLTLSADNITIGAFTLPPNLVARISWFEDLPVSVDDIPDSNLRSNANKRSGSDNRFYFPYDRFSSSIDYVGDERVTFSAASPRTVTVVGVQRGGTLVAYHAENGKGGDILLFQQGNVTAEVMYDKAEADNKAMAWILRFVGFGIMVGGIYLVLRPVEVFADVLPFVGDIVGCGLIFVACVVGGLLSGLTISIAWLIHHPKIGGIVLGVIFVVVGGIAFLVKYIKRQRKKKVGGDEQPKRSVSDEQKAIDEEKDVQMEFASHV